MLAIDMACILAYEKYLITLDNSVKLQRCIDPFRRFGIACCEDFLLIGDGLQGHAQMLKASSCCVFVAAKVHDDGHYIRMDDKSVERE